MKPGWYILNYHNVGWEDSLLTRPLGGTIRPDVFRIQIESVLRTGKIISIPEGIDRLRQGEDFASPVFSLWFDDGFRDIRRCALPICREFQIVAGMSICSRFVLREELYWRCKLAYLSATDGLRYLRSNLRKTCPSIPPRIRTWSLEHCCQTLLDAMDELFCRFAPEPFRRRALNVFDDLDGIQQLKQAGWLIANHSAAHYPLREDGGLESWIGEFDECGRLLKQLQGKDPFWVIPFSSDNLSILQTMSNRARIVLVGEKANTSQTFRDGFLYRISPTMLRGLPLPESLR